MEMKEPASAVVRQQSVEPLSPGEAAETGRAEQSPLLKLALAAPPRPRASDSSPPPGIVNAIVAAIRKELTELLPNLLAPVLQDLDDLKTSLYVKQESTVAKWAPELDASAEKPPTVDGTGHQSQLMSDGLMADGQGLGSSPMHMRPTADAMEPVPGTSASLSACGKVCFRETSRRSMESVRTVEITPPANGDALQSTSVQTRITGKSVESVPATDVAVSPDSWDTSAVDLDEYFKSTLGEFSATTQLLHIPGYQQLLLTGSEEQCEGSQIMDPEAVNLLSQEIVRLSAKEASTQEYLSDLNVSWKNRCQPYENELASLRKEIQEKQDQLAEARKPKRLGPPPPGPDFLQFVDTHWFHIVNDVVVAINLVSMALASQLESYAYLFNVVDNMCLIWYVFELGSKVGYHQRSFLFGRISEVWWAWLDLFIVVAGVADQWLMPLAMGPNMNTSVATWMRFLRLFRLLRFLKIIHAFLEEDLSWTSGHAFEVFMAGVIAFNSVVMALELDVSWAGWNYIENLLLIMYSFELALRLKNQGWHFFVDCENILWHYLDFTMVVGGALDLWFVPLVYTLQGIFQGHTQQHHSGKVSSVLRLLKIMRILRVLRLVRLLHMVKPLYTLLLGVLESIRAMQWVLILTFLTLYACAIVFTNLVGKGLMNSGEVGEAEKEMFGSVAKSLFSLFKLMNGDTSVVEPITNSATGQLLFVAFMVVSNWAILAILTSVVSDNMIRTSQIHNDELEEKRREEDHRQRVNRLSILFDEVDKDKDGFVDAKEWSFMLKNREFHLELCDATGLSEDALMDYFECLAEETNLPTLPDIDKHMDYATFISMLKEEGMTADKRSILRVMSKLRYLESRMNALTLDASSKVIEKCSISL